MISPVVLDYKTFEKERLPKIAVYYIFSNHGNMGLCREFKIDIPRLVRDREQVIVPMYSYEFLKEQDFLGLLEGHKFQAIRTKIPDKMSFKMLSEVIASVHFKDFMKRNFWIVN